MTDRLGWQVAKSAWAPPPNLTGSQWAESGAIILPDGVSSVPGRLSFALAPMWRQMLDWVFDRETESIFAMIASQNGKTLFSMVAALGLSQRGADPILWYQPTDDLAEENMRNRIRPIIRASPQLKAMVARVGHRDGDRVDGVTWKHGGTLTISGVAAATKVKNRPALAVIADEYDEIVRSFPELGDMYERMKARTRTYHGRAKIIVNSTPTVEDEGIYPLYLSAQIWRWEVACPRCGVFDELSFGNVKWPTVDGVANADSVEAGEQAYYQCPHCEGTWSEPDRRAIITGGHWVCMTPDRPGRAKSVAWSTLYSPFTSISKMAGAAIRAEGNPAKAIQFRNEWLVQPVEQSLGSGKGDIHQIAQLRREWAQGLHPWETDVPEDVRCIVAGADVQGNHLWAVYLGVMANGRYKVLWAGRRDDMSQVERDVREDWECRATGEILPVVRGFIDSGYRTAEVYDFCRKSSVWRACKGSSDAQAAPIRVSSVVHGSRGAKKNAIGGDLVHILSPKYFKDQLDELMSKGDLGLPSNCADTYIRHLASEHKKLVKTSNGYAERWVVRVPGAANHMLDATYYALAAARESNVHQLTEFVPDMPTSPQIVERPELEEAKKGPEAIAPARRVEIVGPNMIGGLGFKPM